MSKDYFYKKLDEINASSHTQDLFMELYDSSNDESYRRSDNIFDHYIYTYYNDAFPISENLCILMIDLLREDGFKSKSLVLESIIYVLIDDNIDNWFIFDIDYLEFMEGRYIKNDRYLNIYRTFATYTRASLDTQYFNIDRFEKRKRLYFYLQENYDLILNKMVYSDNFDEKQIGIMALSLIHKEMPNSKKILINILNQNLEDYKTSNDEQSLKLASYCIIILAMIGLCLKDSEIYHLIKKYCFYDNNIISSVSKDVLIISNQYKVNKQDIIDYIKRPMQKYDTDYFFSAILNQLVLEKNISYEFFNDIDLDKNILNQLYFKVYGTINNSLLDNKIELRVKEITIIGKEFKASLFDIYEILCYLEVINHS